MLLQSTDFRRDLLAQDRIFLLRRGKSDRHLRQIGLRCLRGQPRLGRFGL